MNTMSDYPDHYLKTNILLLAHVFEKFVNTCLAYYASVQCEKGSMHLPLKCLPTMQRKATTISLT